MRKLLAIILCTLSVSSFAGMMDSLTNPTDTKVCMDKCDPGVIMKSLGSQDSKDSATNVCKVACLNKCFANEISTKKSSTEVAAINCKDSLKADLNIK